MARILVLSRCIDLHRALHTICTERVLLQHEQASRHIVVCFGVRCGSNLLTFDLRGRGDEAWTLLLQLRFLLCPSPILADLKHSQIILATFDALKVLRLAQ